MAILYPSLRNTSRETGNTFDDESRDYCDFNAGPGHGLGRVRRVKKSNGGANPTISGAILFAGAFSFFRKSYLFEITW